MQMSDLLATISRAFRTTSNDRAVSHQVSKLRTLATKAAQRGHVDTLLDCLHTIDASPCLPVARQARADLYATLR